MAHPTQKRQRWYTWAKLFQAQPLEIRKKVFRARGLRSQIAHLAVLHPTFGSALDEALAPLRVCMYVAWPPEVPNQARIVLQRSRFDRVMEHHEARKRWPSYAVLRTWRKEERRQLDALRGAPQPSPVLASGTVPSADIANVLFAVAEHQGPEAARELRQLAEQTNRETGNGSPGC